jgi:hypothetical protein
MGASRAAGADGWWVDGGFNGGFNYIYAETTRLPFLHLHHEGAQQHRHMSECTH